MAGADISESPRALGVLRCRRGRSRLIEEEISMMARLLAPLALLLLLLLNHPAAADLLVSSFGTDQVLRYNGSTGAFLDAFVIVGSGGLDGKA
jgi:hypothetical protein